MRRRKVDALEAVAQFQKEIQRDGLTTEVMYEEIRLMRFKVRPVSGNVTTINLRDRGFIHALWNLGKLDEFFHKHYRFLKAGDRKMFFEMFDDLHAKFETELNRLNIEGLEDDDEYGIEMEIFKDYPSRKKLN